MPGPVFLSGDRVELRTIEREDLDFMQRAVNDPTVWRAIGTSTPVNGPQEEAFFEEVVSEDDQVNLLVAVDGEATGMVTLTPKATLDDAMELGYWMAPDYREQGYCSEAVATLTDYGFRQRGLHRISARVFAFNDASQALLESLGFTHEGRHREAVFVDGEYHDTHWYSVLADEWN
ncbi:Protein N-acetyltransferase, RimJ/RimL family [Halovenus aranensis]|jgi:RimJ/RimL family protein N-acetyltransferase|uniref:Protein N-acetyltransferase, RimJ/RimL family n=1 Tax=Halovenus aranensis TaxID=890420 RepID=A0A1G8WZJ9_9EURY|nr:GNAT family protein [Halovenus aranensis]SDJ83641.1 Protein N-acetyltransferase, RimJ/RimL family [Halovenus aranensis]